jgi:hypothetical protein
VAAAADGRWWIYYEFPVVIQGTGTEVDQIKLEVGALDARTGAVGWITQINIPQSYMSDASTIGGPGSRTPTAIISWSR